MEAVIASSPVDAGISCWDLRSGEEKFRFRSCASPPHGLTCVAGRFLASSQIRESSSSSGSLLYWAWNKPQPEVKSFPAEPINPLVANTDGTYIMGGGSSGDIYCWEVATGRLLKKWHAHYRAVTCLTLSDDDSLLISGAEDGCIRVWSLFKLFDDIGNTEAKHLYEHSFSEHTLRVTDIVSGYGGCNAIIVSSSEDHTCKIWSISKGKLSRTITFPSIIDAIALDPGENVFYAGSRDGKIYIGALNAESTSSSSYGMHITGSLSEHSKGVTCLAFSMDGISLVSGSDDGTVRVWDTRTYHVVRLFKHAKGPVNNVILVTKPLCSSSRTSENSLAYLPRWHATSLLPPPLDKYTNSMDGNEDEGPVTAVQVPCDEPLDSRFLSCYVMKGQIRELQQQGSAAASEMELERLKLDCKRSKQMALEWKKKYQDLYKFCLNELLDGGQMEDVMKNV